MTNLNRKSIFNDEGSETLPSGRSRLVSQKVLSNPKGSMYKRHKARDELSDNESQYKPNKTNEQKNSYYKGIQNYR